MNIEIERKFKVTESDFPVLKEALLANNFAHKGKKQIVDDYYIVKRSDEYLRIRHTSPPTLDHHKMIEGSDCACEEREVKINDVKMMHDILVSLGHNIQITVDKSRDTYLNDTVEVVLDHIKELGYYVEVEVKGGTIEDMDQMINLLKLQNPVKDVAYPDLLFDERKKKETD